MEVEILKIEENLKERDFPNYIKKEGYKCIRLSKFNYKEVKKILGHNFALENGMPDFLIYNKQESKLCEFKSETDHLSLKQIAWRLKNNSVPLMWAIVIIKKERKIKINKIKKEMAQITIYPDEGLLRELKIEADRKDRHLSGFILQVLKKYFAKVEN